MPYIRQKDRCLLEERIHAFFSENDLYQRNFTAGEWNYIVTRMTLIAMKPSTGWDYDSISSAIRVLNDSAAEMRRRLLDPYEDKKIEENGDVF
jgi:hypothetical protein